MYRSDLHCDYYVTYNHLANNWLLLFCDSSNKSEQYSNTTRQGYRFQTAYKSALTNHWEINVVMIYILISESKFARDPLSTHKTRYKEGIVGDGQIVV